MYKLVANICDLSGWRLLVEVHKIFQFENEYHYTSITFLISLVIIKIKRQRSLFLYGSGFASKEPGKVNVCLFSCWMFPLSTLWIRGSSWVGIVVSLLFSLVFNLPHCPCSQQPLIFQTQSGKGRHCSSIICSRKAHLFCIPIKHLVLILGRYEIMVITISYFTQFFQWSHCLLLFKGWR